MDTDSEILKVENLSKSFRSQWTFRPRLAISNISFSLQPGESVGFLGHNGAGKTTTLKCILGLIRPTTGSIKFCGQDASQMTLHEHSGFLPELPYFYEHLSVYETLDLFAALYGLKRRHNLVLDTLARVGLVDRKNAPVQSLSKGLQQRLAFAQAIINSPKLLLLDEPFSGLDPIGRQEMRELILEFKHKGTTILLSSHILPDVESICDSPYTLPGKTKNKKFYLRDMSSLYGMSYEVTIYSPAQTLPPEILTRAETHKLSQQNLSQHQLSQHSGEQFLHNLYFRTYEEAMMAISCLSQHNLRLSNFSQRTPSLEQIFVQTTESSNQGSASNSNLEAV